MKARTVYLQLRPASFASRLLSFGRVVGFLAFGGLVGALLTAMAMASEAPPDLWVPQEAAVGTWAGVVGRLADTGVIKIAEAPKYLKIPKCPTGYHRDKRALCRLILPHLPKPRPHDAPPN